MEISTSTVVDNQPTTATQASWKDRLSLRERGKMLEVFQEVLDKAENTLKEFKTEKIEASRILVVMSAYDAKDLLQETLRETTEQLKQSGLNGEMLVILNNGGGNTTEFINSNLEQSQLDTITKEIGVNEIVFGKTERLNETVPNSKSFPRKILLDKSTFQKKNGIRLIIIEQQNEPDNYGKIRGLRDIYELLKQQNQETGYCPQYLLAIDAETRIRPVDTKNERIITDNNTGLSHMIELSDEGKNMVGARLQFIPYDHNGNPDWKEKTPPMQEAISIVHGMKGYEWLPGGGTLGGFPEMVSILNSVSQKLPGTRIEDVLTTVMAKTLGIKTIIDNKVVHANRCPKESEKGEVFGQMSRWLKGSEGLRIITGKYLAEKVISNKVTKIVAHSLTKLAKGKKVNIPYLLKGLPQYVGVSRLAKNKPDDFIEGEAVFK